MFLFVVDAWAQAQKQDTPIRIPATLNVNSVEFAQDGSYFLALDRDTLRIWDVPSGKQLGVSIALSSTRGYATFLPGDSTILTMAYSSDRSFNIWDWRSGKNLRKVELYRTADEAVVSADGRYVALRVYFPQNQYELWDVEQGTYVKAFAKEEEYEGLWLRPTGTYGTIKKSGIIYRINIEADIVDVFHMGMHDLFGDYLSDDGKRLGYSRFVAPPTVFDVETLDSVFILDIDMSQPTRVMMDFSPDNRWIATTTTRRFRIPTLDIWDGANGDHIAEIGADSSLESAMLQMSPRNDYIVTYNSEAGILLWPIRVPVASVPAVTGVEPNSVSAYPNPSSLNITIKWPQATAGAVHLTIYNVQGQQVYTCEWNYREPGVCTERIQIGDLSSGSYFSEVESSGRRYLIPFVVEH